jgi:hypothetical protein
MIKRNRSPNRGGHGMRAPSGLRSVKSPDMWPRRLFVALAVSASSGQAGTLYNIKELRDSYDFIIAGGGTAGLTVADRLSEAFPNRKCFATASVHLPLPQYISFAYDCDLLQPLQARFWSLNMALFSLRQG